MADVLALIPARAGSKGIPNKNFRELVGVSPVRRAVRIASQVGCNPIVLSTDYFVEPARYSGIEHFRFLNRPPALATDSAPMIDVVRHVLSKTRGPANQIVVLLQPTQPLRSAAQVQAAIQLLRDHPAIDSVVSVVEIPQAHRPEFVLHRVSDGFLSPWLFSREQRNDVYWDEIPARRQDAEPAYIRDGTVYAFRRRNVWVNRKKPQAGRPDGDCDDSFYGRLVLPLIIPPEETCPLDTPEDWANAERRLRALSQVPR